MRSRASFRNHPIHPMLIPIPIGAVVLAIVFNALHVWQGGTAWFLAAFVSTVVAVLGIVAAAVPGFIDYWTTIPRSHDAWTTATRHMILGVVTLVIFAASALYHWWALPEAAGNQAWIAFGINLVGGVAIAVQGYLGGTLTGHHGIGMAQGVEAPLPESKGESRRERRRFPGGGS